MFAATLDRPFTGLLYIQGGLAYFSSKGHMWRWHLQSGVVGSAAMGEEVQRWHHKNFGLPYPYGWETQLPSGFGVNVHGAYYYSLLKNRENRWLAVYTGGQIAAGLLQTQGTGGLLVKLGLLEQGDKSSWWNARLQGRSHAAMDRPFELFLYLEPLLTYQLYNATVQGNLYSKNKEVYTTSIQPYVFSHNGGIAFSKDRYSVQASVTFKTKEARTMRDNEMYGTLQLSYRFP